MFGVDPIPNVGPPRFDVAPGQDLVIVRNDREHHRELAMARVLPTCAVVTTRARPDRASSTTARRS